MHAESLHHPSEDSSYRLGIHGLRRCRAFGAGAPAPLDVSRLIFLGVWVGLGWLGQPAWAEVVQLRPVADTTLIETAPDNNMGSMTFFNAGTAGNGYRNRGLLQFDLAGLIPRDAIIQSAALELTVVQTPTGGQGQPSLFGVHRVLQPWGEGMQVAENPFSPGLGAPAGAGEATWNHRFFGGAETWFTPGGEAGIDFVATPSSVELIEDIDLYLFDTAPRMVSDVQAWVSDPQSNFGWMLQSLSEDVGFTARRFGSREDVALTPLLTVTFEVVPEPAGWLLALAGWLAWVWPRRIAVFRARRH